MPATNRIRTAALGVALAALLPPGPTQAGAPWQTLGRFFGVGHGPGYHAGPGCYGACGAYGPAPCAWPGEPSTFPIPRTGWMTVAQPASANCGAYQPEPAPVEIVPTPAAPSRPAP